MNPNHDPLCACALREHSCENSWAGTHCTKCQCDKIARVVKREKALYLTAQAETGQMVSTLAYDLSEARLCIEAGIEAFRLTKEYVNTPDERGDVLLPDITGWSHFDWTERARALLEADHG